MTWYKVDDSFHSHPKATATSLAALGLWVVAGSWSGNHLTDGFVPDHVVRLLSRGSDELAGELVSAGLWKRTKGGYQFHDWDTYQPTKAGVLRERAAATERQRRRREKKSSSEPVSETVTAGVTGASRRDTAVSHGEVRVGSGYVSSSADSSVGTSVSSAHADAPGGAPATEESPPSSPAKLKRGGRIPADFVVTPEMVAWARVNAPDVDGRLQTAAFIDYWKGIPGQRGVKLDWVATWRNWMRDKQERAQSRPRKPQEYQSQTDGNIAAFIARGSRQEPLALPGGAA